MLKDITSYLLNKSKREKIESMLMQLIIGENDDKDGYMYSTFQLSLKKNYRYFIDCEVQ